MSADQLASASQGFSFEEGGYRIDLLFQGYPGKSAHHGGLGWSTVVLLRGNGHTTLIDTGPFGYRRELATILSTYGLKPRDVTKLILSHAHHDHIVNYVLFDKAEILIGSTELRWARDVAWGLTVVPELYVRELSTDPRLKLIEEGDEVLPSIRAYLAPGHTPGHLIFVLSGRDRDIIFLQDAVKTRAELISRDTDMTFDPAVSARTVEMVWEIWRKKPGSILIPGHDLPMVLDNDHPKFLGKRTAGITATFGSTLEDITRFDVTPSR
jgi:N-acyl homoserine lactone hydrolase